MKLQKPQSSLEWNIVSPYTSASKRVEKTVPLLPAISVGNKVIYKKIDNLLRVLVEEYIVTAMKNDIFQVSVLNGDEYRFCINVFREKNM